MVATINFLGKGYCEQGGPELPSWGFHSDPLSPKGQAGKRRGRKQLSDRLRSRDAPAGSGNLAKHSRLSLSCLLPVQGCGCGGSSRNSTELGAGSGQPQQTSTWMIHVPRPFRTRRVPIRHPFAGLAHCRPCINARQVIRSWVRSPAGCLPGYL